MNYEKMEKEYHDLCTTFGVYSGLWSMIHENFSPFIFCDANKKSFIAEYLIWENFVERAKEVNFVYYYGIDDFLQEYKRAVYSCLNL